MSRFKSSVAVPMVTVLFLMTLCATGAMTVYRVSSAPGVADEPWQVIPQRVDNSPAVAPRPGLAPAKPAAMTPDSELRGAPTFTKPVAVAPDASRMAHQVRLASDGLLPGRLNVIDPVTGQLIPAERVTLNVVQNGKVVTYVKPGVQGVFQVPGLEPGVYSIVVVGENGRLAYAVEVLPPAEGLSPVSGEGLLQINGALALGKDLPTMEHVLSVYGPTSTLVDAETGQIDDLLPAAKVEHGFGLVPLDETPVRDHLVTMLPDGRVVGRVWKLDPQTAQPLPVDQGTVYFIRDGLLAGQTDVGLNGAFEVKELRVGSYSVVAVSKYGLATFSVQVQEPSPPVRTVQQDRLGTWFISTVGATSAEAFTGGIDVSLTSFADFNAAGAGSAVVCVECCPACAAGAAGGIGGGGWLIPPIYWDDDDDDDDPKSPFDPFYRTENTEQ